eukprot:m51a1_g445 putative protein kinase (1022) ;mRNA; f:107863-111800
MAQTAAVDREALQALDDHEKEESWRAFETFLARTGRTLLQLSEEEVRTLVKDPELSMRSNQQAAAARDAPVEIGRVRQSTSKDDLKAAAASSSESSAPKDHSSRHRSTGKHGSRSHSRAGKDKSSKDDKDKDKDSSKSKRKSKKERTSPVPSPQVRSSLDGESQGTASHSHSPSPPLSQKNDASSPSPREDGDDVGPPSSMPPQDDKASTKNTGVSSTQQDQEQTKSDMAVRALLEEQKAANEQLAGQFQQQIQQQKQQHLIQQQTLMQQLEMQKQQLLAQLQQQANAILQQYQAQQPAAVPQVQMQLQAQTEQQRQYLGQQQQQQMQALLQAQQQQQAMLAEQQQQALAEHQALWKQKLDSLLSSVQQSGDSGGLITLDDVAKGLANVDINAGGAGEQKEGDAEGAQLPAQEAIELPNDATGSDAANAQSLPSAAGAFHPDVASKPVSPPNPDCTGTDQQQQGQEQQQQEGEATVELTPEQQQQVAALKQQLEKLAADHAMAKQQYTAYLQQLQQQLLQIEQQQKQAMLQQQQQVVAQLQAQKHQMLVKMQQQAQQLLQQAQMQGNQAVMQQIQQRFQQQTRTLDQHIMQQQQQYLLRIQQQAQAVLMNAQAQAQQAQQQAMLNLQKIEQQVANVQGAIAKIEGKPIPPQAELPLGWAAATDPQGRVYYINLISKTSTWERPTVPADQVPAQAKENPIDAQVQARLNQLKLVEKQLVEQKKAIQDQLAEKQRQLEDIKLNRKDEAESSDTPVWMIDYKDLEFEQKIGEGGFGDVYRAKWHGTTVAVKTLKGPHGHGDTLNPKEVEKFSKEVTILRALHHPQLVLFIGACLTPRLCMISEYMVGGSLYDLLYKKKMLPSPEKRKQLSLDIARAMAYLHQSTPTVIHRDLKSPNILLDEKAEHAKVCDVGLAKVKETSQVMTGAVGTFYWMPPEMLRGHSYNEKVDVYSFGLVVYEICVAKVPFMGMSPQQIKTRVGQQNERPQLPTSVPSKWRDLIQACWDADDTKRPPFIDIIETLTSLK